MQFVCERAVVKMRVDPTLALPPHVSPPFRHRFVTVSSPFHHRFVTASSPYRHRCPPTSGGPLPARFMKREASMSAAEEVAALGGASVVRLDYGKVKIE